MTAPDSWAGANERTLDPRTCGAPSGQSCLSGELPGHAAPGHATMRAMQNSRARAATAAGFLTQGMILLSLTTRLPDFQDKWAISDVQLSLVLLMMVLLAGVGSVVAETLAKKRDSAL